MEIVSKYFLRGRTWATALHLPTGISVTFRNERNQLLNKEKALAVIKSKLGALMQAQGVALKDVKKPTSENVANNPIREYVFHPDQKVKDLRTNVEISNIEEVMEGNLDLFTKAFLKQDIA
ncbi:MAG: peptide chain release factor-like protein [Cyanobacteria bacterium P01_A01_bin.80]